MFKFLKNLSLFSILTLIFLLVATIVSLTTSYISLRDSSNNVNYQRNNLIADNYATSLTLGFKLITSPLKYGQEYMNRYTIFNSTVNDFISMSTLNNTSINTFISSLSLYYTVNDIDRQIYETRLSNLLLRPITFVDYIQNGSIVISPKRNIYLPVYFTSPITNFYAPGLDITSFNDYKQTIDNLLASPLSTIVSDTRKDALNQTLLEFGTNTANGLVVVTLLIENIIRIYILNNERVILKKDNVQIFTNCNVACDENKFDKDIYLPNGELLIASFIFNSSSIDLTTFLFVLLGVLLVTFIVTFIIFNFEIQKSRFMLADKMLGYINHEIRNPLNCINGMIDVSIIQYEEESLINDDIDKEILNDLTTAKIACDLLGHIINDIIDLKGMSDGKLIIKKNKINVNSFLRDFNRLLVTKINEYPNIEFKIRNPEQISFIYFDEQRLFQILINFVTNALKHTNDGSIILLVESCNDSSADLENGNNKKIRFSVIDTGIGIKKTEHSNIFKPFTQSNLKNDRTNSSVGLGLFLCKMIMEQINGKIGFTSEFGKGSTFYIEFINEK